MKKIVYQSNTTQLQRKTWKTRWAWPIETPNCSLCFPIKITLFYYDTT